MLDLGFNCVLQMPTGSGKTWLARTAIANTLSAGYRAIYLTPTRALASELFSAWRSEYGEDSVGIFTGEYGTASRPYPVSFLDAQLLLMTPERFDACTRHWRAHWHWLPEVDLVVVDEFHLLGDGLRGARLEGALSRFRRLNPFARIVALSATLGNRAELADWLDGVEYHSTWRPIPLEWKAARFRKADEKPSILVREVLRAVEAGGRSLVFAQSRRRAEFLADFLRANELRAAHHHAGLDHDTRARVEQQFRDGTINVLVSTATLEVGLNLPARQVVLYDLQEFDGTEFKPLRTTSVWQRAGRAGRFGLDDRGEAVLIAPTWERTCDRYPKGDFESVRSQLADQSRLSEQVLIEISSGLARTRTELRTVFADSLAFAQGVLPDVDRCIDDMLTAGMLSESSLSADDDREVRLRATRIGRVAVRHMLEPRTVLTIRTALQTLDEPTFFDLALLAASTADCEPVLPCDFEDLEILSHEIRGVRSNFLAAPLSNLRSIASISQRRLLAGLKMAAVMSAWTRTGDAEAAAAALNCYPFEVRRLAESMSKLLTATCDLLRPERSSDSTDDAPSSDPERIPRVRAELLATMIGCGLNADAASLTLVRGLGPVWARRLAAHGVTDVEDLAQSSPEELAKLKGLSLHRAQQWVIKAETVIKSGDIWTSLGHGPRHEISSGIIDWPVSIDPYRLRRAAQLTVAGTDDGYSVTGGLDPHRVSRNDTTWRCDCMDFQKGHLCKHILAVRLARKDPEVLDANTLLMRAQSADAPTLSGLWLAEEPNHAYGTTHARHQNSTRRHPLPGLRSRDDIREEVPAG